MIVLLSKFLGAFALIVHIEICGLCSLKGHAALAVVAFGHVEIKTADHAVRRPREAHHGGEPWKSAVKALENAKGGEGQTADGNRPEEAPNVCNQALGKFLLLLALCGFPLGTHSPLASCRCHTGYRILW